MKTNKTWLATLAVSGLLALSPALLAADTTAPSDGANHPHMKGGMRGPNIDRLAKDLNLTDDQKTKVQSIFDDQRQKMMDLRKDTSLSRDDRRSKMKELRKDMDTKLKAVLTPDQFKKFQDMGKQMREHHRPPQQ